jgi:hypothetical protein
MKGRPPKYSEEDRARVFVGLRVNNNNVARTSRDTGVPARTIRDMRKSFDSRPPNEELVAELADTFIVEAKTIRSLAMEAMKEKIPNARLGELNAVVGTLTDKLNLLRGVSAKQQVDHVLHLPDREELQASLGPVVAEALAQAREKDLEVIEGEAVEVEPLALVPRATA